LIKAIPIDRSQPYPMTRRIENVMAAGVKRRLSMGRLGSGHNRGDSETYYSE
jgi:hypothetical protein